MQELAINSINFKTQVKTDIHYKGIELNTELRLDLLVENTIVLELKAVEVMHPLFTAQLLSYMNILQKPKGILINFNCENIFKVGQKTLVNNHYAMLED
jgi:GxxExxY protein